MKYDYLIVGAGLFGAVFAHEATKRGKRCLVVEKRGHIAGNVYTEEVESIRKRLKAFRFTSTAPIFFIRATEKYGIS